MSREVLVEIVGRLLADRAFREHFFADREAALVSYNLPPELRRWFDRITDEATLIEQAERLGLAGEIRKGVEAIPEPELEFTPPSGLDFEADPPERIVSTGFATEEQPEQPLGRQATLMTETPYYFWFEVGERVIGSIEVVDTELPTELLPPQALLQVALFAFEDEIAVKAGEDVGEIRITPQGKVRVAKAVARPPFLVGSELLSRRLFFPVRTPPEAGTYRLRCNVYYEQTLVQSRLITARVGNADGSETEPALKAEVDYTLSKALNGRQLQGMGQNRLSVMLNDDGNGTHGFRFFGQKAFKNDATLGEGELQDLIRMARGAMQKAAWGDEEQYRDGKLYRYMGALDEQRLKGDLVTFALRGYRFYDALINRLAGDAEKAFDLADLMLKPGQIQIASKESLRLVIPVAMFYDYPLDDGRPTTDYGLCRAFLNDLRGDKALEESNCFQGNCPSYGKDTVVCPSGFWGYRHSLGLPVSVRSAPDAPSEIPCPDKPHLAVSVSTDPNFRERPKHEENLKNMGFGWDYADERDETLEMLKQTRSQVVYFYCHGGVQNNLPYLRVGPVGSERLTRANLRNSRIRWREIRPIVFINGCHTTALSPEAALDFVSGFVETSNAAGVIGTEITIFEPIAVTFAEAFFRRFLQERQSVGEAIRGARLQMLKEGNPLGLVYIPYVLPGLRLT